MEYIFIDGFKLGTNNKFTYDDLYLKKRYKEFNEKYFDGELPNIPLKKVVTKNNYLGVTQVRGSLNSRVGLIKRLDSVSIDMNSFYERSERVVCSTLIHEMIHVYEASVMRAVPKHETIFKKKMNEINAIDSNWNISITETVEEVNERGSAPKSVLENLKNNIIICALKESEFDYLLFLLNKKNIHNFDRYYEKYKGSRFFEILDPTEYVNMKVCRNTVTAKRMVFGILEGLIKQGKIKEISITDDSLRSASSDGSSAKIKKIEKNCYLTTKYDANPYFDYRIVYIISKKSTEMYSDMWDYLNYAGYAIYDIKDGTPFKDCKILSSVNILRNSYDAMFKVKKDEFTNMVKEGMLIENEKVLYEKTNKVNNKLNEATASILNYIERDPYTEVNKIKKIDDDFVEIDLTIS